MLLASGADKNALDPGGRTPLVLAVAEGHLATVETLLATEADLHLRGAADDCTALHYAACEGSGNVVAALLLSVAAKNALSHNGQTPLSSAAEACRFVALRTLLDAGADHRIPSNDGSTPLIYAAEFGNDETMDALLLRGVDKDEVDNAGNTPLSLAAGRGHLAAVEVLMSAGADLNLRTTDDLHLSAFDMAASNGRARAMEAFLSHGQDATAVSDTQQAGPPCTTLGTIDPKAWRGWWASC